MLESLLHSHTRESSCLTRYSCVFAYRLSRAHFGALFGTAIWGAFPRNGLFVKQMLGQGKTTKNHSSILVEILTLCTKMHFCMKPETEFDKK